MTKITRSPTSRRTLNGFARDDDKRWGLDRVPRAPEMEPTAGYRPTATYPAEERDTI